MSFVFAEIFTHSESGKENIQVFCDTRIELPDSAGAHFSNIEKDKKSSLVTHRQEKEARLRTFLVWTNRRASVYAESYGLMVC